MAYGLGISANGGYRLSEWPGPTSVIDWIASPLINQKGKNTLRVITSGNLFQLYINGSKVNETTDSSLTEGWIQLYVTGLQEVEFDNFTVVTSLPLTKPTTLSNP